MNRRVVLAFAAGPVLAAGLSFISLPFIAWYFSPEDIGRNNIFHLATSLFVLFCVLGLDQAYVREFHETEDRGSLMKACFAPGMILLLAAVAMTIPFAGDISRIMFGKYRPLWYYLTAICIVCAFISRFLSLVVRMQERGSAYSASQILPKIAFLCALMGLVFFGANIDYTLLLYANVVSLSLVVFVLAINTRADWCRAIGSRVSSEKYKKLLHYGLPLIGAGLAYWGLSATSTIMLRIFSGFREIGIYSMAMSIAGAALILQSIFSTVWMPTVYKWVAAKEDLNKIDIVTDHVLAVVSLLFALTGIFSWTIDYLLPADYNQVRYIILCCMAQPLLYTLSETTVVGLNVQRKSMHAFGIAIAALVTNLICSYFLVPTFGAAGAAASNALAYLVFLILRTELSVMFWRKFPRFKVYTVSIVLIGFSILTALAGPYAAVGFPLLWLALFVIMCVVHHSSIAAAYSLVMRTGAR